MQALQKTAISTFAQQHKWELQWHSALDEVAPDDAVYTVILAHEFFDALPFHRLLVSASFVLVPSCAADWRHQRTQSGWREVLIASGQDPTAPQILRTSSTPASTPASGGLVPGAHNALPRFHEVISDTSTAVSTLLGASSQRFQKLPVGSRIEVSPASFRIARRIGEILSSQHDGAEHVAGCALVMDYGDDNVFGDSFRVSSGGGPTVVCRYAILTFRPPVLGVPKPQDCGRVPSARRLRPHSQR